MEEVLCGKLDWQSISNSLLWSFISFGKCPALTAKWLLSNFIWFGSEEIFVIPDFAERQLRHREFNSLSDVTYPESAKFRLQHNFLTLKTVLFEWFHFKRYLKCPNSNNHYTSRTYISLALDACDIVGLLPPKTFPWATLSGCREWSLIYTHK